MHAPSLLSLDEFPVGCLVTDDQRRIIYTNQYMEKRFGCSPDELTGTDVLGLFSKASRIFFETFMEPLLAYERQCEEMRLTLAAGAANVQPVMVSIVVDATQQRLFWSIQPAQRSEQLFLELKDTQQQLEHQVTLLRSLSDTDPLTGLPNRTALSKFLDQKIAACAEEGTGFALAFIDLDGFKEVNDRYGQALGDQVLKRVAKRLACSLRQGDLVARFGGDEFVVVLAGLGEQGVDSALLAPLTRWLATPFILEDVSLSLSASIGVTPYPQAKAQPPDLLLRQADQAMYQAKLAGKNQVCVFDIGNEEQQKERHSERSAIGAAVQAGQFELYYQPKIQMRTGEVIGAEALLRWHHPVEGLKGPDTFLPALSNTRCGRRLGHWVITRALEQLHRWHQQGLVMGVSVNIDGYHLQHTDFLSDLSAALADFPGLPKHCLELEVLETSTIRDVGQVAFVINACRALGLRVSLDDFGTGYSSLSHLRDLMVDTLKIDRSFVQNMLESRGDLAILKGVIGFAQAFECEVIAEGVETREHSQKLLALGCEYGQGYYFAKPMPASAFPGWVARWYRDHVQTGTIFHAMKKE